MSLPICKSKCNTSAVAAKDNSVIGRYEGEWASTHSDWVYGCAIDGSNFAVVGPTEDGRLIIDGFIEWIILKTPPSVDIKQVGCESAEEVTGYFDTKLRTLWICGYRVFEQIPLTVGRDVYKIKLLGDQINCRTKSNFQDWSGKFVLNRVATRKELREIFLKFTPLGSQASGVYLVDIAVSMVHFFEFPKLPRMPYSPCYEGEGELETLVRARILEASLEITEDRAKPYVHTHPESVLG